MNRFRYVFFAGLTIGMLLLVAAKAQTNKLIAQISQSGKQIYLDNLDQVYLLTNNDELLKYDENGHLLQRYSSNKYGRITSVDVRNPLRVLVFYADFQQLVVLDNMLSVFAAYSFVGNTQRTLTSVANAGDNQMWAFDSVAQQLLLYNWQGKELSSSVNLSHLTSEIFRPKQLYASDNAIFMVNSDGKIWVFDRFGAFLKVLTMDKETSQTAFFGDAVWGFSNGKLSRYGLTFSLVNSVSIDLTLQIRRFAMGDKIIALLTEKAVLLQANK